MIKQFIKDKVAQIKNKEELYAYISRVQQSIAPLEERDNIISYAKEVHSAFLSDEVSHAHVLDTIEAGAADIDDIGN
jgi:hypothetical protein